VVVTKDTEKDLEITPLPLVPWEFEVKDLKRKFNIGMV
jgi:hypothetical protein